MGMYIFTPVQPWEWVLFAVVCTGLSIAWVWHRVKRAGSKP
jgi:hypothetical protein